MRQVHDSVHVALESSDLKLGQLCLQCYEFGPSGHRHHPAEGVAVGYTCRRRRAFRHKCMVRPEAVHDSLYTRVHEFELKPGWASNTDLKQGKERAGLAEPLQVPGLGRVQGQVPAPRGHASARLDSPRCQGGGGAARRKGRCGPGP